MRIIVEKHNQLEPYFRYAEKVENIGPKPFWVVVCMFPAMSELLLKVKRGTIDTSFKRASESQELEIESWFDEYKRCRSCSPMDNPID